MGFDPRTSPTDFSCFVTLEGGWGRYEQHIHTSAAGGVWALDTMSPSTDLKRATLASGTVVVAALYGSLTISSLTVRTNATAAAAQLDGKAVACKVDATTGTIAFTAGPVVVQAKSTLTITLSGGHVVVDTAPIVAQAVSRRAQGLKQTVRRRIKCAPNVDCSDCDSCPGAKSVVQVHDAPRSMWGMKTGMLIFFALAMFFLGVGTVLFAQQLLAPQK